MKQRLVALVRAVPNSFSKAVSSKPSSSPIDVQLARQQWQSYVSILGTMVDDVQVIPADDAHPDCCFIEGGSCAINASDAQMLHY